MRTLPESISAAFKEQQGLNVHFVIAINWMNEEEIWYSDCEFENIYAYVREFSNYESISHVEGLGSVSSIDVAFNDQFGHFKERIDTVDFFNNTTATIYITLDGIEFLDLFEGKITDGSTWSNNVFSIQVVSNPIDHEIGYQPTIDDVDEEDPAYDSLSRRLVTESSWPALFGYVKNYEIPLVRKQRQAEVQEDVIYDGDSDPTYYQLIVDSHEDFDVDTDYNINLVGKERDNFSILGTGQFKTVTIPAHDDVEEIVDAKVFRLNKVGITSKWYSNIAFEFLEDVGISGETDSIKSRIEITPGEFTIETVDLETTGPDGEPTLFVWAQFMKLEIRYTSATDITTVHNSKYVNCIKQEGNTLYLNEKVTLPEDATAVYIRSVFKANDIIWKIPSGSKVYVLGDRVHYVVDTHEDTEVLSVGFINGEKIQEIDSSAYEVSSVALWTGTCPPVTYIHMLAEVYMRFLEFYDTQDQKLIATARNTLITDKLAIQDMAELPVVDGVPKSTNFVYENVEEAASVIPEVAWQTNKALRFIRVDNDDAVELIDLTTPGNVLHVFDDTNVLRNSVAYGFTPKDKVYTVFKGSFQTNDLNKDLEVIKYRKNVDKYKEVVLEQDYYVFSSKASAKTSLEWWRDKLSQYYYMITLTGFMDAFHLEVWDRVGIDFNDISFYDPTLGSPFVNTHTASPLRWNASGRVKSMSPDLVKGTIDFTIELDTVLGESTTNHYVPEF